MKLLEQIAATGRFHRESLTNNGKKVHASFLFEAIAEELDIVGTRDRICIYSSVWPYLDPVRHKDICIAVGRLSTSIRPLRADITASGRVVIGAVLRKPTPKELAETLDRVVHVSRDFYLFILHVLETFDLRCDPDMAVRWFAMEFIEKDGEGPEEMVAPTRPN